LRETLYGDVVIWIPEDKQESLRTLRGEPQERA
jgi:hypothetical protein